MIKNRNIKKTSLLFIFTIFLFTSCEEKEYWANRYNVKWDSPSEASKNSMPMGGHDIGCNVWVEDGDLFLYAQKSGCFSDIGEMLKLGRIRIQLSPNPFENYSEFSQELVLKDGNIKIHSVAGAEVDIKLWVDIFTESVHVDINSEQPISYKATYENWRTEDKILPDGPTYRKNSQGSSRKGSNQFNSWPGELIKKKDEVQFENNKVVFYHRNPEHTMDPEFAIKQQDMEAYKDQITNATAFRTFGGMLIGNDAVSAGTTTGTYYKTSFKGWSIESKEENKHHHLTIATYVKQEKEFPSWKQSLDSIAKLAVESEGQMDRNKTWWNEYWDRSYIVIDPENKTQKDSLWRIGRNYNLFRYQLGLNYYGDFPTKFNGGLLVFDFSAFDPDYRSWGGNYHTAQNQRLVYWPMLKSGDFEAMLPQFELYMMGLPGAEARVQKYFGHKGAFFCENTDPAGMIIPKSWGWNDPGSKFNRPEEVPFGDPRIQEYKADRSFIEKGVAVGPAMSYYAHSQIEFAYMMLEYNRFSDESIKKYIPFIKSACVFYDEHYKKRHKILTGKELDKNGKLRIFPASATESYNPVTNPTEVIAGLNTVITNLMANDNVYLTKAEITYFKGFLNRIPEFTWDEIKGKKVIAPAEKYVPVKKYENPRHYPLFPYNMYSVVDKEIETFINTYKLDTCIIKGRVRSWSQEGIFLAHMGLVDECVAFQKQKLGDAKLRFPTFWGPGNDWVPDHNWGGSGMIGLQDMLMQTPGDKIILLPCWPDDKDVNFKLHAPKQTVVEVEYKNGKIQKLKVTPESRRKDIVMAKQQH